MSLPRLSDRDPGASGARWSLQRATPQAGLPEELTGVKKNLTRVKKLPASHRRPRGAFNALHIWDTSRVANVRAGMDSDLGGDEDLHHGPYVGPSERVDTPMDRLSKRDPVGNEP